MKNVKKYKITSTQRVVRDAASVEFHVESNDYFGTAATVIRLLRQDLDKQIKKAPLKERTQLEKSFKNLEEDLMILQRGYHIKANKKKSQAEAKGRLKSQ